MNALKYPVKDEKWVTKFLFSYLSFIPVIGSLIVLGYNIKAIRENAEAPQEKLPEWDDWGRLIMDGLIYSIIGLVYMVIPLTLWVFSLLPLIMSFIGLSSEYSIIQALSSLGPVVTICMMIAAFILTLVGSFLLPMAAGIYAITGSIFGALNFMGVIGKIFANMKSYIIMFLVSFGLGMAWSFVAGMVMAVPFIGQLIIPFFTFPACLYMALVMARMLGEMFRENSSSH